MIQFRWAVVSKCAGCKNVEGKVEDGAYCSRYYRPAAAWSKLGGCNLCTVPKSEPAAVKVRKVNPLKASKRGH
jgi:hypothetical protein